MSMMTKTWGRRGLITIKHLKALGDLYHERETLLRNPEISPEERTQIEDMMAEQIRLEKINAQKEKAKPLNGPFEHEYGVSCNLELYHAYESQALDKLFPPLIAKAIKDGNEQRTEEYNREYQERIKLMRVFHNQERDNFTDQF